MHLAIQENREEIVVYLLEHQANPNIRNYEGECAIHVAIKWSSPKLIDAILEHGGNPNLYNKNAESPLHICVSLKLVEAARTLMLKGANLNYQDSNGQTPFHLAVSIESSEMSKLFFESGSDPDVKDANLKTVWDICSKELYQYLNPKPIEKATKPDSRIGLGSERDFEKWNEGKQCYVCKKNEANRVLLPCRHKVVCNNCSSKFFEENSSCPICSMAVYAAIKDS